MKCLITMLALLLAASVYGQDTRGTIVGRVTDPTGAVVPAAQVVITNKNMGTKVSISTNEEGLYRAPLLIAGTYEVTVEIPGFKKFVRDGVELRIADQIEIDAQLQIGPSDVSVTVSTETPLLTTETGSLGSVVDSRRIADLPISYGNPFELIGVAAGVTFARDPRLDRPF